MSLRESETGIKILTVVGARPQFIKAAVVSRAIAARSAVEGRTRRLKEILVHTGQHYDDNMSAVFFRELDIPPPAHNLTIGSGPHGQQTGRMLEGLERVIQQERPDLVLVYGDTNSTLAGALAASKLHIPIAHVEAGLRSYNRVMPEEINRVLVDHLSSVLFCPADRARKNLSNEGITAGVHVVGDVMLDSLLFNLRRTASHSTSHERLKVTPGDYAVLTLHRAENVDDHEKVGAIIGALKGFDCPVVFPVHPRTQAILKQMKVACPSQVRQVGPLPYLEMLHVMRGARLILTDSGGLQKEAFFLKVPCVTLRNETEWVETVETGWNRLAGTNPDAIRAASHELLKHSPCDPGQPYGDGHAGEAVVQVLSEYLGGRR